MTVAVFVPLNALAPRALESMRVRHADLALAVDEYGIVQGIVTIHDVLRSLAGEGAEPHDVDDGMARRLADQSWLMDGLLETNRFKELLALPELPITDACRTLGGLVMSYLGRVPSPGDEVQMGGVGLEISRMVGNRVGKVRVTRQEDEGLA